MELKEEIAVLINEAAPDKIFVATDSNVALIEAALIHWLEDDYSARLIITPAGEENKTLEATGEILARLSEGGATRRSLLICVGGGLVTDIGGFAAAIFKRGIRHINVATTLLGAVDAAVGGKTGVDFKGLKNEIGAFHLPLQTLFDPAAFRSLPPMEVLSGFGEVVKTALIGSEEMTRRVLAMNPLNVDEGEMAEICRFCRDEKMRVVEEDPTEKGVRKVLNFGHTAGHAMESLALEQGNPVAHGVAVAHGLLVGLILSHSRLGMESSWVTAYSGWLRRYFPPLQFTCKDYDRLWLLATHDKKNREADHLAYTLLERPGAPRFDISVDRKEFEAALDLYQELQGR